MGGYAGFQRFSKLVSCAVIKVVVASAGVVGGWSWLSSRPAA